MRERHNIVGTEVDRPRPPIYASGDSSLHVPKRRTSARLIIYLLVGVSCLGLIVAAVV